MKIRGIADERGIEIPFPQLTIHAPVLEKDSSKTA